MGSVYDLKPRFQDLLRSLANNLAGHGITANHVTMAAVALSVAAGVFLYRFSQTSEVLLLLPLILFIRMALNAIDGMLAREHNMKSSLGAILNELGDVFSDLAIYFPLAFFPGFPEALIALIVILAVVSEMTGVIAVQIGASRRYDGPMGKSDRAFVFSAIGIFYGIGMLPADWLSGLLISILILLCVTIYNRARAALTEVRRSI